MRLTLLTIFLAPFLAATSRADSIKDVMKSPEMEKFKKVTEQHAITVEDEHWFEKDSNYGKIFLEMKGSQNLLEWLGNPTDSYRIVNEATMQERDSAEIMRTFETRLRPYLRFTVHVLVPHPKFATSRQMGLLKEFQDLENVVRKSDTMEVRGHEARYAERKDGSCLLLFNVPRDGLVALTMKECESPSNLVTFAESLEWGRFFEKLAH